MVQMTSLGSDCRASEFAEHQSENRSALGGLQRVRSPVRLPVSRRNGRDRRPVEAKSQYSDISMDAMKLAEPRLPAIAPNPGRSLKKKALLPFGGSEMLAVPMVVPVPSRTVI